MANQLNLSPAEIQRIQNAILPRDVPGKYAGAYREILIINQERVARNEERVAMGLSPEPTLDAPRNPMVRGRARDQRE